MRLVFFALRDMDLCSYNVITRTVNVKTELIRIGNSRGVRIPKPFIAECRLGESVDLRVENGRLIVSSERRPREGWAEAFNAAGPADNDELLLEAAAPNDFDQKEWRW